MSISKQIDLRFVIFICLALFHTQRVHMLGLLYVFAIKTKSVATATAAAQIAMAVTE